MLNYGYTLPCIVCDVTTKYNYNTNCFFSYVSSDFAIHEVLNSSAINVQWPTASSEGG